MADREERNRWIANVLALRKSDLQWLHEADNDLPSIHDEEGNVICTVPLALLPVIDRNDQSAVIIETLASAVTAARLDGYNDGQRAGSAHAIEQFHEMMGINKLCATLREVGTDD